MEIDEIIDRLHKLSRAEKGSVLTDDDRKLLASAANQMSAVLLAVLDGGKAKK